MNLKLRGHLLISVSYTQVNQESLITINEERCPVELNGTFTLQTTINVQVIELELN